MKLANNQANAVQHPEADWQIFTFFIHVILKKIIGHILKNKQKNACIYSRNYTINHNENEDENEK